MTEEEIEGNSIRNPNIEIRNNIEYRRRKFETIRKSNFESENGMPAPESHDTKPYDLEERTFQFVRRVRAFVKSLPRTVCNVEDPQLIRSSGSIGANYIEANESLGKKDFGMRIKISRKEAKEACYWLRLLDTGQEPSVKAERNHLMQESSELMKIFGAIVRKTE